MDTKVLRPFRAPAYHAADCEGLAAGLVQDGSELRGYLSREIPHMARGDLSPEGIPVVQIVRLTHKDNSRRQEVAVGAWRPS